MGIIESATRLFDLLSSRDRAFTKYLLPGLSKDEIGNIIAPLTIKLPPEVVDFYSHFNLPANYAYGPDQATFLENYWLTGLEDAVKSWQFRRNLEFLEEREHDWFPFLQEDGNGYLVDSVADPEGNHNIISVFHALEAEVEFLNLTAMFDTFYYWLDEGVVSVEAGHIVGAFSGDQKQLAQIAVQHNPGIGYWVLRLEGNKR